MFRRFSAIMIVFLLNSACFAFAEPLKREDVITFSLIFFNVSYGEETKIGRIGYPSIRSLAVMDQINRRFKKKKFQIIEQSDFVAKARLEEAKPREAVQRVYREISRALAESAFEKDFSQKMKNAVLISENDRILSKIPYDFDNTYVVIPVGMEFEDSRRGSVAGRLGLFVVDQNSQIIASSFRDYDPTSITQPEVNRAFSKMAKRCLRDL